MEDFHEKTKQNKIKQKKTKKKKKQTNNKKRNEIKKIIFHTWFLFTTTGKEITIKNPLNQVNL